MGIGNPNAGFLDPAARGALADALGDIPQTVMSTHRLRRGLARAVALVDGAAGRPPGAIVQAHTLMTEPAGFGDDPERIWRLLRGLDGWTCVHVAHDLGEPLAAILETGTGRPFTIEDEIYFWGPEPEPDPEPYAADGEPAAPTLDPGPPDAADGELAAPIRDPGPLDAAAANRGGPRDPSTRTKPVLTPPHALAVPNVRRLTPADAPLLEAATIPLGMTGWRFGSAMAQLTDGFAAGAVVAGDLVAVAFTASRSARYGEIGVVTRERHRGRGYAAAAAALVAADMTASGLRVVWSTGVTNVASRRVAAKLGLTEVSRRAYVNRVES